MEISVRLLPLAGGSMTSETEEVMVQHMPYTSGMAPSPQRKAGGAEKLRDFLLKILAQREANLSYSSSGKVPFPRGSLQIKVLGIPDVPGKSNFFLCSD